MHEEVNQITNYLIPIPTLKSTWASTLTMASADADLCLAPGNNNNKGTTFTPSWPLLSQQQREEQFVSAKTDRGVVRSHPIIISASDAPLQTSNEQWSGLYNTDAPSRGGLHLKAIITQGRGYMPTPTGLQSRHTRVVTPTFEDFVSIPPNMDGQNKIIQGSSITDEAPDYMRYGFPRDMCLLTPSEPTSYDDSSEGDSKTHFSQSNGPVSIGGTTLDDQNCLTDDFRNHLIIDQRVCLLFMEIHDKLEWMHHMAKALVHVTQQTYIEMNHAMHRFFLYFLITHWVEEVIKWVLAWRLVSLQPYNIPQHGVGHCSVTLNDSERICILQRASVRLLSLQLLFAAPGTAPVRGYSFRNDGRDLLEQLLKALL